MGTFLEFYMALLKFANFKLFTDMGLSYPLTAESLPISENVQDKRASVDAALDCNKVKLL